MLAEIHKRGNLGFKNLNVWMICSEVLFSIICPFGGGGRSYISVLAIAYYLLKTSDRCAVFFEFAWLFSKLKAIPLHFHREPMQ